MRTLITGGAGFIGSHLAEALLKKGPVRILDNFSTGSKNNVQGLDVELVSGSIVDEELVERCVQGIDLVVHLAAHVSVPLSMLHPTRCARENINGLLTVLDRAERAGVKRLVFASSAAIYGNNPTIPKTEDMHPEPQSPYALTKWDGEFYCDLFSKRGNLSAASARFFNVFGPRQSPNSAYAAAVPRFITNVLSDQPIEIFGDGKQTRDFVHVADVVSGLTHLAMNPMVVGSYNIGYGVATSILDLARSVFRLSRKTESIKYAPSRMGDVMHSVASIDKIKSTGWNPLGSFDEGLAKTFEWYASQRGS